MTNGDKNRFCRIRNQNASVLNKDAKSTDVHVTTPYKDASYQNCQQNIVMTNLVVSQPAESQNITSNKLTLKIDLKKAQFTSASSSSNNAAPFKKLKLTTSHSQNACKKLLFNIDSSPTTTTSRPLTLPQVKFKLSSSSLSNRQPTKTRNRPFSPSYCNNYSPNYSNSSSHFQQRFIPNRNCSNDEDSNDNNTDKSSDNDSSIRSNSLQHNPHNISTTTQNITTTTSTPPGKKPGKRMPTRKKPPKEIYKYIISSLKQRDHYGFFLKRVNTNIFTDYLSIIDNPIDLGMMYEKASNDMYPSLSCFRSDLELLVSNAKKYNPKGSAYYKSADRLLDWGSKLITKYLPSLQPSFPSSQDKPVNTLNIDANDSPTPIEIIPSSQPLIHSHNVKRRRKLLQELESNLKRTRTPYFTLSPNNSSFLNGKLYNTFSLYCSSKYLTSFSELCYYSDSQLPPNSPPFSFYSYSPRNPLLPLNSPLPNNIPDHLKSHVSDVFGGSEGLSYSRSIESFTNNLYGPILDACWSRIDHCTMGCFNLIKNSFKLLSDDILLNVSLIEGTSITETEYGSFDIALNLGKLYSKSLEPIRSELINEFNLNGIDVLPLTNPVLETIPRSEANVEIKSLSHDKMLQKNIIDIASFFSPHSTDPTISAELMERIRRRLLILVKRFSTTTTASPVALSI